MLLDFQMPKMNGIELIEKLRNYIKMSNEMNKEMNIEL